jgi:GNAT superfamily N-acetyltransferase
MAIRPVQASVELDIVRKLFREYWTSFGFTPCFQGFEAEVANLPGDYAPPGGRLALAFADGEAAGCVALRRFDTARAEAKRLYVRPAFRGRGMGRSLLEWLIAEARAAGYNEIVCDTMPVMSEALNMYARSGFERTGPYSDHATAGAIYLRLTLN